MPGNGELRRTYDGCLGDASRVLLAEASVTNSAVTDVLGVATATEPYSGQRFFQVSTKWLPWSSSTPQILKWIRTSAYRLNVARHVASESR